MDGFFVYLDELRGARRRAGPTPRYMGLTGTASANDAAERAYHVFARRAEDLDEYSVAHTSFTFPMANT